MILSFIFWNVMRRPLGVRIARLAKNTVADIIIVAECDDPGGVLDALNKSTGGNYHLTSMVQDDALIQKEKLCVFSALPRGSMITRFDNPAQRLTIRQLKIQGSVGDVIVAIAHLPSQFNWSRAAVDAYAGEISRDIIRVEQDLGHQRTVLVGDINLNPFDTGLVGSFAMNAVSTRHIARRGKREVQGKEYPFFYNPMWAHFSDRTVGPAGTYFLRSPDPTEHYWNILDQVLLRPELMDRLNDLRIQETDGDQTLVTDEGVPDTVNGSDHLPLFFSLEL
jgi:hypothetical protein